MSPADWEHLLGRFEALGSPRKTTLSRARNFARYMEASGAPLNEETLLGWLQLRVQGHHSLANSVSEMERLGPFLDFLSSLGLCREGLHAHVAARPDLLQQLQGGRPYDSLPPAWQSVFTDFELSLRGAAPLEQAVLLDQAARFVRVLERKGRTAPSQDVFLEWMDAGLIRFSVATVAWRLAKLNRFTRFLLERRLSTENPVDDWHRTRTVGLLQALQLRKEGRPLPPAPPPPEHGFLQPLVQAFVAFKRTLGRKYDREDQGVLKQIDRFVHAHDVHDWDGFTPRIMAEFLQSIDHWQPRTRTKALVLLALFFRFVLRSKTIPQVSRLLEALPRVRLPPRLPHIYTIHELVAILTVLKTRIRRHPFSREAFFTLFHLVYACGLRISEATRLQIRDVDLKERTLNIRNTKFFKNRLIPFGQRAGEYLQAFHAERLKRFGAPDESDPFFVGVHGNACSRTNLEKTFAKALTLAGVRKPGQRHPPRIHDLRHTMAVHRLYKWYLAGVSPQDRLVFLSIYMGHVSPETSQYYLNLSQDILRIAGRPLERSLENWFKSEGDLPS